MLLSVLVAATGVAAGVLELDLNRINIEDLGGLDLSRRATYVEKLANNITGGGYYVDFSVGTPPQPQRMVLDTGSSDIWVVANDADLCTSSRLQLYHGDTCAFVYDRTRSSSYTLKERRGFSITYLDGTASKGDYFTDTLQIANFTLQKLQMGVATQTIRGTGVMGIGFSNHVAAAEPYPNIIDELALQKVIAIKAYSLYLNDRRSSSGTILFGGVDTDKFIGTMSVLPIIPDITTRTISTFTVAMSGLSFAYGNGTSGNITMPATTVPSLLDSGTTLSYLPAALADPLFRAVGAWTDSPQVTGYTYIDCKHLRQKTDLTINFSFSNGPTIVVPASELVLDVVRFRNDMRPPGIPFTDICLFGIQSTTTFESQSSRLANSNFVLLGDTFLRSAYVVYDLTHAQIGLAQSNLNSTKSNIIELAASNTGLPALSGVKAQEVPSGTEGGNGGVPTVTVTAAPNPPPNAAGRAAPGMLAVSMMGALAAWSASMSLI